MRMNPIVLPKLFLQIVFVSPFLPFLFLLSLQVFPSLLLAAGLREAPQNSSDSQTAAPKFLFSIFETHQATPPSSTNQSSSSSSFLRNGATLLQFDWPPTPSTTVEVEGEEEAKKKKVLFTAAGEEVGQQNSSSSEKPAEAAVHSVAIATSIVNNNNSRFSSAAGPAAAENPLQMDQLIGKAHAAESSPSFPTTTTNNLEGERRRDNHLPRLSAREFDVFLPVAAASTTKKKTDALDGRLEEKTVDGECILHNFTVENLNDLTSAGLTLGAFDFRLFGLYAGLFSIVPSAISSIKQGQMLELRVSPEIKEEGGGEGKGACPNLDQFILHHSSSSSSAAADGPNVVHQQQLPSLALQIVGRSGGLRDIASSLYVVNLHRRGLQNLQNPRKKTNNNGSVVIVKSTTENEPSESSSSKNKPSSESSPNSSSSEPPSESSSSPPSSTTSTSSIFKFLSPVYSVEISRFPEEESEEDFKPFILGVVNTRSRQIIQPFATGRNISFVLEKEALLTRMFFLHPKTGLFSVNRKEKEALIHHNFSAAETGNKNTTTETGSNNKSSLTVSLLEDGVVVDRARIEVTFAAASNQQKQKQQREEGHHPMSGKSNDDNTILHAFEFEQLVYAFAVSPNAVDSSRNSVEVGHLRIQRQQPTDAGNSSSPSSSSVVGKEEDEKVEYSISAAENGGSAGGRRFVLGRKTGFLLYTGPFERDSSNHTLKVVAVRGDRLASTLVHVLIAGLGSNPPAFSEPLRIIYLAAADEKNDANVPPFVVQLNATDSDPDSHLVYSLVGAAECRNAAVLGNLSKEEECLRRFQFFGNGTITLVAADDEKKKLMDKNNNGTEDELPLELKPSAETVYLNVSVADVAHSLEPKAYASLVVHFPRRHRSITAESTSSSSSSAAKGGTVRLMKQQQSLQERIESGGGGWPRELTVSNRFPAGSHIHFFNVTSAAATNFLREDSVAYKFSLLDSESSPFAIGENDGILVSTMPLNGGGFTDRRYNLTILVVEKRGVVGSPAEGVDNGVNDSEKRDSSDHAPSTSDDKPEHAAAKFNVSIVVKSKLIGGGPRFDRHFYEFDVVVGEVEEKQKHNDGRHDDEGSPSFVGNLSASGGAGRLNFSIISYYSNDGEDREDSSRDDDKSDNTEGFGFRIDSSGRIFVEKKEEAFLKKNEKLNGTRVFYLIARVVDELRHSSSVPILVNLRSSSLLHSESAFRIPSPLSTHLILPETLPPGSFVWALDCTLYVALPSLRVSLEEVAADDSLVVVEQQQQNEEEADEHFQRRETLEKKRKRLANAFSISIQQQNGSSSSSFSVVLRTRRSLLGLAGAYPRGLVVVLSTAKGDSDEKNGTRPRKEKEEKEWPLNITILARSQCAPMFDHGQDAVFYVVNGKTNLSSPAGGYTKIGRIRAHFDSPGDCSPIKFSLRFLSFSGSTTTNSSASSDVTDKDHGIVIDEETGDIYASSVKIPQKDEATDPSTAYASYYIVAARSDGNREEASAARMGIEVRHFAAEKPPKLPLLLEFVDRRLSMELDEDALPGTVVTRVRAIPRGGGGVDPMASIRYRLLETAAKANNASFTSSSSRAEAAEAFFGVDPTTGDIRLLQPLDYDTPWLHGGGGRQPKTFDLRISATVSSSYGDSEILKSDNNDDNNSAVVHIEVIDVNDNDPVFEHSEYHFVLLVMDTAAEEDDASSFHHVTVTHILGHVRVTDRDRITKHLDLQLKQCEFINIDGGGERIPKPCSAGKKDEGERGGLRFSIDSDTGKLTALTSSGGLSLAPGQQFRLELQASDGERSGRANVTVWVYEPADVVSVITTTPPLQMSSEVVQGHLRSLAEASGGLLKPILYRIRVHRDRDRHTTVLQLLLVNSSTSAEGTIVRFDQLQSALFAGNKGNESLLRLLPNVTAFSRWGLHSNKIDDSDPSSSYSSAFVGARRKKNPTSDQDLLPWVLQMPVVWTATGVLLLATVTVFAAMMCHYRRQFRTDCAVLVAAKEMQDAAQKCPSFDAAFERLSRIVLPPPPPPFHPATAFPLPFFFSNSFWPAIFYYYQQALKDRLFSQQPSTMTSHEAAAVGEGVDHLPPSMVASTLVADLLEP